jgi:hypothetical protein
MFNSLGPQRHLPGRQITGENGNAPLVMASLRSLAAVRLAAFRRVGAVTLDRPADGPCSDAG